MTEYISMKVYFLVLAGFIVLMGCTAPQKKTENMKAEAKETAAQKGDDEFFADTETNPTANIPHKNETPATVESGFASWYGKELQGRPTASGEMFDMSKYTAAHRTIPMGSVVLIKNLENGKKQLVRINDRGPYVEGRIIDVSYATAKDLGFAEKGVARVEIEVIQKGKDDFLSKAANEAVIEEPLVSEAKPEKINEDEEMLLDEEEAEVPANGFTFADGKKPAGYTIQVGAFKKRANAEKHRDNLEDKYNRKGFIATEGDWNHVWLGDMKSSSEAKKFLQKLKQDGYQVFYRGKISKSPL